jgi:hypothetical protein
MDKSYEVTPEDCNEAITKKYIFKLGSRHHCAALEHWF